MDFIRIVLQIALLYLFYLAGSWIQVSFDLFIPGSIIGMLLLLGMLGLRAVKTEWVERGGGLLVRNLPLLFLPVTIGIIQYFDLFAGKGLLLLVIVFVSTVLVMLGSGFASQWVWGRGGRRNE